MTSKLFFWLQSQIESIWLWSQKNNFKSHFFGVKSRFDFATARHKTSSRVIFSTSVQRSQSQITFWLSTSASSLRGRGVSRLTTQCLAGMALKTEWYKSRWCGTPLPIRLLVTSRIFGFLSRKTAQRDGRKCSTCPPIQINQDDRHGTSKWRRNQLGEFQRWSLWRIWRGTWWHVKS